MTAGRILRFTCSSEFIVDQSHDKSPIRRDAQRPFTPTPNESEDPRRHGDAAQTAADVRRGSPDPFGVPPLMFGVGLKTPSECLTEGLLRYA